MLSDSPDEEDAFSQVVQHKKRRKAVVLESPEQPAFKTPSKPSKSSHKTNRNIQVRSWRHTFCISYFILPQFLWIMLLFTLNLIQLHVHHESPTRQFVITIKKNATCSMKCRPQQLLGVEECHGRVVTSIDFKFWGGLL